MPKVSGMPIPNTAPNPVPEKALAAAVTGAGDFDCSGGAGAGVPAPAPAAGRLFMPISRLGSGGCKQTTTDMMATFYGMSEYLQVGRHNIYVH